MLVGLGATAFLAGCSSNDAAPSPEGSTPPAPAPQPTGTGTAPAPAAGLDDAARASRGAAGARLHRRRRRASPTPLVVPAGYTATVLYRLGDPIAAGVAAYKNDGTDSADSHAQRAGDHHDGMHYFGLGANGKLRRRADGPRRCSS